MQDYEERNPALYAGAVKAAGLSDDVALAGYQMYAFNWALAKDPAMIELAQGHRRTLGM